MRQTPLNELHVRRIRHLTLVDQGGKKGCYQSRELETIAHFPPPACTLVARLIH